MTSTWTNVNDGLPSKRSDYLVVKNFWDHHYVSMATFSPRIEEEDIWDFEDLTGPLWFDYNSESGYFPLYGITHWMPLPQLPLDIKENEQ